ncbi:RNA polymerase I specific transcription initiation factor [Niveomyces insectorum RCEF 264]|uniref:RNA polymerase I specific transcription initiation factor n=1 Tax=Niveomyces insectorum RCEF 264 TaxID=1081102 RepID=A0A167NA53_9HYPO|nr:RNA polymerase I specific transcription initiation factor [Niveomyces insectorum RCEF 264]
MIPVKKRRKPGDAGGWETTDRFRRGSTPRLAAPSFSPLASPSPSPSASTSALVNYQTGTRPVFSSLAALSSSPDTTLRRPDNDWSDPDTASIASRDSAELRERRPNRWRGTATAWRALTESDRLVMAALHKARDRDLAAHLYNVFALKQQAALVPHTPRRRVPRADNVPSIVKREPGLSSSDDESSREPGRPWAPHPHWTAWPLRVCDAPQVGQYGFVEADDGVGSETYCAANPPNEDKPSRPLEELLTATILRLAKERFRQRKEFTRRKPAVGDEKGTEKQAKRNEKGKGQDKQKAFTQSTLSSSSEAVNRPYGGVAGPASIPFDDEMYRNKDEADTAATTASDRAMRPVVSADDDRSAALLRPTVRHLLTQLDLTLTVLHHVRVATAAGASDDDDDGGGSSSSGDDYGGYDSDSAKKADPLPRPGAIHSWIRPPHWRPGPTSAIVLDGELTTPARRRAANSKERTPKSSTPQKVREPGGSESQPPTTPNRVGRPPKERPRLPGESDEAYQIRIARLTHRSRAAVAGKGTVHAPDADDEPPPPPSSSTRPKRIRYRDPFAGWRLRDWSDVLGAAALAGFDGPVVARTAQRCADLFNQGMALDTLPVGSGTQANENATVRRSVPAYTRNVYTPRLDARRYTIPTESEPDASDTDRDGPSATHARQSVLKARRLRRLHEGMEGHGGNEDAGDGEDGTTARSTQTTTPGPRRKRLWPYPPPPRPAWSRSPSGRAADLARRASIRPASDPPNAAVAAHPTASAGAAGAAFATGIRTLHGWCCPHEGCPRAAEPFTRRMNLLRHLAVRHGHPVRKQPKASQTGDTGAPASGDAMSASVDADVSAIATVSAASQMDASTSKQWFCTQAGCPRAAEPFTRRANLRRHLQTMHSDDAARKQPTTPRARFASASTSRNVSSDGREDAQDPVPTAAADKTDKPAVRTRDGTSKPWFCPHVGCLRAAEPFTRRLNMVRHVEAVHGAHAAAAAAGATASGAV